MTIYTLPSRGLNTSEWINSCHPRNTKLLYPITRNVNKRKLMAELLDTMSNEKFSGFRYQLKAFYMSGHIEELYVRVYVYCMYLYMSVFTWFSLIFFLRVDICVSLSLSLSLHVCVWMRLLVCVSLLYSWVGICVRCIISTCPNWSS